MDIYNWIIGVHKLIFDMYNNWILWVAMAELWIFMIDCVYT